MTVTSIIPRSVLHCHFSCLEIIVVFEMRYPVILQKIGKKTTDSDFVF